MPKTNKGLSLTELLIASILVCIVVAGVFAADFAIRRIDKMSSLSSEVYMQTNALAETIRKDIKHVHGYIDGTGTYTASGVYIDLANQTFCFRKDVLVSAAYTPSIYTDDIWSCYTQLAGTSNVHQCDLASPAACAGSDLFVGTLVLDEFTNVIITPKPTLTLNPTTGVFYFSMLLVNRKTPSAGADISGGALTPGGTQDNPQVKHYLQENVGAH